MFLKGDHVLPWERVEQSRSRDVWEANGWDPTDRIPSPPKHAGSAALGPNNQIYVDGLHGLDSAAERKARQRQVWATAEWSSILLRTRCRLAEPLQQGRRSGDRLQLAGHALGEVGDRLMELGVRDTAEFCRRLSRPERHVQVVHAGGKISTPRILSGSRFDPVYAHREAQKRAAELTRRTIAALQVEDLVPVFATLTQRACETEPLEQAINRLDKAFDRMRKLVGWEPVWGCYRALEVTRGGLAKRGARPVRSATLWGRWWHPHLHCLVLVHRQRLHEFLEWLPEAWPAVTEVVAAKRGLAGFGAERRAMLDIPFWGRTDKERIRDLPIGGGVFPLAPLAPGASERFRKSHRLEDLQVKSPTDWDQVERHAVLSAIKQVVKYAVCVWKMGPVEFIEAYTVLHGKRLHTFSGGLFGAGEDTPWARARAWATRVNQEASRVDEPPPFWLEAPDHVDGPELGRAVTSRYGAPSVEQLAPGYLKARCTKRPPSRAESPRTKWVVEAPPPVEELPPPLDDDRHSGMVVDLEPLKRDAELAERLARFVPDLGEVDLSTVKNSAFLRLRAPGHQLYPLAKPFGPDDPETSDEDRSAVLDLVVPFRSHGKWFGLMPSSAARSILEESRKEVRAIEALRRARRAELDDMTARRPPEMVKDVAFDLLARHSE